LDNQCTNNRKNGGQLFLFSSTDTIEHQQRKVSQDMIISGFDLSQKISNVFCYNQSVCVQTGMKFLIPDNSDTYVCILICHNQSSTTVQTGQVDNWESQVAVNLGLKMDKIPKSQNTWSGIVYC
jgi:hypothetical protein